MLKLRLALVGLVALALLLQTACGGGSALNPRFQPEVANLTDNFQFQTTGITNISESLSYTWQNSGTRDSINQACSISKGTAILTVRDSNGTAVYQADLVNNGTFTSIVGATGAWRIDIALSNVSGTMNFRVQKTP